MIAMHGVVCVDEHEAIPPHADLDTAGEPRPRAVPQTLEGFLEGIEARAVRIAALAVGDRETALDLVQEAMVQLIAHYPDRPAQSWSPLFWRILQSRIRDTYRRRRVRQRVMSFFGHSADDEDSDPIGSLPDQNTPGPDRVLGDAQFARDLERALAVLPLRQQQAFLLRHWEGLDTAATAAALGISEGSVKTHLSRALHSLQARLEAYR